MSRFALLFAFSLLTSFTFAQDQNTEIANEEPITAAEWLSSLLKEKDAPDWVSDYLLCVDVKIKDPRAHTYFRKFIADRNTRLDGVQKFVEYLSLAGYPEAAVTDKNTITNFDAEDIYKAVYFAVTYTIMDGLPKGPAVEVPKQPQETEDDPPFPLSH